MILVHLAQGFEEIEAVTILDILRRGGIKALSVSMENGKTVEGAHGISIEADVKFDEADYSSCKMIILPGGMPGTKNLMKSEKLMAKIKEFVRLDRYVAAICAAPMVFGTLGLLDGKNATIYPGMEEHLKNAKPSLDNVVVDGRIITSRGPGTAIEFALKIIEILEGKASSDKIRKDLVL